MELSTLGDVRALMARHRVTQRALAEALGRTPESLSYLMAWEEDVVLSAGAGQRWASLIEEIAATKQEAGAR